MDNRMADSEMAGDIQSDAFDGGVKCGRAEMLKEVLSILNDWKCHNNKDIEKTINTLKLRIEQKN